MSNAVILRFLIIVFSLPSLNVYGSNELPNKRDITNTKKGNSSEINNEKNNIIDQQDISKYIKTYITGNECGPFAIAIVLKYWGEKLSLSEIKTATEYNYKTGTKMSAIRRAFENLDFNTATVKLNYSMLQKILDHNIPAIVGYGEKHIAVVLPPTRKDEILLVDVLRLKQKYLPSNEFCKHWNGIAMFVSKNNSTSPRQIIKSIKKERRGKYALIATIPLMGIAVVFISRSLHDTEDR